MKLKFYILFLCLPITAFADIFFNPLLGSGADPWCQYYNGFYYFMNTDAGLTVTKAPYLTNPTWGIGGSGAVSVSVFTPPAPYNQLIWAPELHYINGHWYLYYSATTANDTGDINHRMFCAEADTQDPQGSYTFKGQVFDSTDLYAIDGTVLQASDGSLYFVWCGRAANVRGNQNIYIAPMSNPWTISGPRVLISSPGYSWEAGINEGPRVLVHNGVYYIIYSANCSCGDNYCLGQLTDTGPVLNASSWVKKSTPVFSSYSGSDGSAFAPGRASFTKSYDGTQDWMVYHTAQHSGSGFNRQICAQEFFWNSDGTPNFGHPIPTGDALTVPSGEAARNTPPVTALTHPNGSVALYGLGQDGALWISQQTSAGGSWSPWTSLGGAGLGVLDVVSRTNGGDAAFITSITPDNSIWMTGQTNWNGPWSPWFGLGGTIESFEPTIYPDGTMAVFAISAGSLWTIWQTNSGGNTNWSAWTSLGGSGFATLHVVMQTNGTAVVYGMGPAGNNIWTIWQTSPEGAWSSWVNLGGTITKFEPTMYPDGTLALYAISGGSLWTKWQTSAGDPGANWSEWATLGGAGLANVHMVMQPNGAAVAYAMGAPGGSIWTIWQTMPKGAWSSWASLGGVISDFKPILQYNGSLSIYAISDGSCWTIGQTIGGNPGANWSSWTSLGGSFQY